MLLICGGLVSLVAVVYWPTRNFGFVDYDDPGNIYQNPHVISGLTAANIRWAFTDYWVGHWAPLTWISFQWDQTFFHLSPGVMHLESAGLHAMSTLLLFALLMVATGKYWKSAIVAAVFAVHPQHVESVAWLTERRDVISAPPLLASMIFFALYARSNRAWNKWLWYAIALLCYVISLLGKSTGVTLPAVLLLCDVWPLERIRWTRNQLLPYPAEGLRWSGLLLEKLPFLLVCGGASWQAMQAQKVARASFTLAIQPMTTRVMNALVSYMLYVSKFIIPIRLAVYYPLRQWSAPAIFVSCIGVLVLTVFALRSRRERGFIFTGWFSFLIVLLPMIGLITAWAQAMADRYSYLSTIGLTVAVVWGASGFKPGRWLGVIAGLWIAILTISATRQVQYWRSSRALFKQAIVIVNGGEFSHIQLANLDLKDGDRQAAQREYTLATQMEPDDAAPEFDLGNLLIDQPDQAIPHYQRAISLQPHFAQAENNLAVAWIHVGRADLAIPLLQAASTDDPAFADPHANLGLLLLEVGQPKAAANEFAKALQIDPQNRIAQAGMARIK